MFEVKTPDEIRNEPEGQCRMGGPQRRAIGSPRREDPRASIARRDSSRSLEFASLGVSEQCAAKHINERFVGVGKYRLEGCGPSWCTTSWIRHKSMRYERSRLGREFAAASPFGR